MDKYRVPYSVPGVDLAIVHVVLFSSVEDKFTFMGSIFLIKKKMIQGKNNNKITRRQPENPRDLNVATRQF